MQQNDTLILEELVGDRFEEEEEVEREGVQDRASQSGAGHGIFPTASLYAEFPPIWRIWPHAADFGIWRRGRDSPVSPFPQNFPTPELAPSPQLDRAGFAETA